MTIKKSLLTGLVFVLSAGVLVSDGYAAKKLDLKLKLKKGQKFAMRTVTDQKILQTVMGQEQKMNQMTAIGMSFEVLAVDTDGAISIKTIYQTIQARIESLMGVMEYDSTKPEETGANNPMLAIYKAMLGQSFVMKMSPKGGIIAIEGIDEMMEKMIDKMATDENMKQQMKEMMKNFISEEKMKEMSASMVTAFPPEPVAVGDSWTNKMSISAGFPMEIDTTCTLTEYKDGIFTIRTNSKIEPPDKAEPIEMGPVKMTMRMKGEQKGTTEINEATGWMVRSKVNMNFSGELKMEPNEQMPEGMTIPMVVDSVITVEPMELK
jgi:hypothetical protein